MRTQAMKLLGLVSVATALLGGCGDSSNNNGTGGVLLTGIACTANVKQCINDRVARVCPADETGWIVIQCEADETCQAGDCKPGGVPAPCTAADNGCVNASEALRCSASGTGFDLVSCPNGTTCVGAGLCDGGCIVGSSICTDEHTIATCTDGKTYSSTACGAGQACVRTADQPFITSACKAGDCTPDANGCDASCGNKVDAAALNPQSFVSVCTETKDGYKWVATSCVAPKTCSPSAASCAGGGTQAGCSSICTPGEQRCVSLAGGPLGNGNGDIGTGYQTCTVEGSWGAAVTACNTSPTTGGSFCFARSADPSHVVCGDVACSTDTGACDETGLFHACDADGRVAATGVACQGTCVGTGNNNLGSWQPGHCVAECQPGDERCTDPNGNGQTYQVCGTDLRWGAVAACSGTDFCQPYSNAAGQPRKTCGECVPGEVRCSDNLGNSQGSGTSYVQTCGSDGHFAAPVVCAVGRCAYGSDGNASCVADCFPGAQLCIGASKAVAGSVYFGTAETGTCSADGRIPVAGTGTLCMGDATCRQRPNASSGGATIGCTVCVGTANEFGLPDTRCVDAAGAPGFSHVQTCMADGTGWNAALLACGGVNSSCFDPSTNTPAPPAAGSYCHGEGDFGTDEATMSALAVFGASCNDIQNSNATVACPSRHGGITADCCADYCYADSQPSSAFCGISD